jgi:excisionase family DNA binding protein
MAWSHFRTINPRALGVPRRISEPARPHSGQLVHLRCMTDSISSAPGELASAGAAAGALTIQELAAELHVSCQTLYDLRSQGRGPAGFRIGRHLRFRRSEIDAWLARLEGEDAERHPAPRQAGGAR